MTNLANPLSPLPTSAKRRTLAGHAHRHYQRRRTGATNETVTLPPQWRAMAYEITRDERRS